MTISRREFLATSGATLAAPAAFAKHTADEVERWRKVTAEAKIQLN